MLNKGEAPNASFVDSYLNSLVRQSKLPGIQYVALNAKQVLCGYEGGLADIKGNVPMNPTTTLMAYSMSKTITAVAMLQLAEAQKIRLEDSIDRYLTISPYGPSVTIGHLLSHTAGIPNPIPLRWIHPTEGHAMFDEDKALSAVLRKHSRLSFQPGTRFQYSNLAYWLLGKIVEQVSGQNFASYVTTHVLETLGATPLELGYVITDRANHATGYLEKYSLLNLFKGFLFDREYWGGYESHWLRIHSHYVNGPAFGGLVGSAQGFARFLMDQLQPRSVLLNETTRALLYIPQRTSRGELIPMTLGWHVGNVDGNNFFYKEGGGGGFRSMMRVYSQYNIATVVMTNATGFDVSKCLNTADRMLLESNPSR
jgi:D-alanyl-D-alanine carboxypeptidase